MTDNKVSTPDALALIANAINESEDDVQPGVKLDSLEGWDSMGVLMLMAEFDDQFDIVLDEYRIKALETVDDILAILEENERLLG